MPWIPRSTLALDRNYQELEIGCGAQGEADCWWQPRRQRPASSWSHGCPDRKAPPKVMEQEGTVLLPCEHIIHPDTTRGRLGLQVGWVQPAQGGS